MAQSRSKRAALGVVVLILIALFVPPFVNVGRFKGRIVEATSNSLGRPVTIGDISLRLLPQPGFSMEKFVVGDDPAFSAEPILRADEVRATLRMSSLWRGRLEVAKLSLQYPSLNLVRSADGKLNLESLLSRASHTNAAPTTAKKPESRPRFPYIEADAGRINFKSGIDKKAFSLGDTDFALWSETENEWRMRLVGKPLRTDTNVSDTGTLRVEGSFRRADNLRDTPIQMKMSFEKGQLGQITKLIYGRDRGWRGTFEASGTATGTPADLKVTLDAAVQDLRRYDIKRGEALRVQTHCSGNVSSVTEGIENLNCQLPAETGTILVAGDIHGFHAQSYDLNFSAEKVPMNWAVALARHAKRDLPDDLSAAGHFSTTLHVSRDGGGRPKFAGQGTADEFALKSQLLGKDLLLGTISLGYGLPRPATRPVRGIRTATAPVPADDDRLLFPSISFDMGGAMPMQALAWISPKGYQLLIHGDAELARLMQVARVLGIGVPRFQALGPALVSVELSGEWRGFVQPSAEGTILLKNARAEIPGIAKPVQIAKASVTLAQQEMRIEDLSATVDTVSVTGTAVFPRSCADDDVCTSQLNLAFDEIDPEKLNALVNPRLKQRPWYRFFGGGDKEQSVLSSMKAKGTVTAKRIVLRAITGSKASGSFELVDGKLTLRNIRADVMGGSFAGSVSADFSGKQPTYDSTGSVTRANLASLNPPMKDGWGTALASGNFKLEMSGWTAGELASSAEGDAQFEFRDGTLRHVSLDRNGVPLRFTSFAANFSFGDGTIHLPSGKLLTQTGIYQVSGTATLNRELELEVNNSGGPAYKVTGTLEKPQVVAVPAREAEALLKR
jgi:uncharacterized protein involved in outer membrane biogenesis